MFKLSRSGSSFLAEALSRSNYTCQFKPELTNSLDHSNCTEIVETIDGVLHCANLNLLAGYTLNPFKFGEEKRCGDKMRAAILRNNAAVVVLTRDNFVAQTVSDRIAHRLKKVASDRHVRLRDYGPYCDTYHLYKCMDLPDEFTNYKVTMTPADLIKSSKDKKQQNNHLLESVNKWFGKENVFHIRFEQIITFPHHNMTLPVWMYKCGICRCECDEIPTTEHFGSRKPLRERIANFDEIHEHVATDAPELLPWLES